MDSQLIKSLIEALAASDLAELEYSHGGETLRLTRRAGGAPTLAAPIAPSQPIPHAETASAAAPLPPPAGPPDVLSPLYGIVHLRPAPEASPFVSVGQTVCVGQTLCVVEAMKVFNEVRAEHDGTVRAVLIETGQEVDIGQPLFRLG